jgi:hypothetical protein
MPGVSADNVGRPLDARGVQLLAGRLDDRLEVGLVDALDVALVGDDDLQAVATA